MKGALKARLLAGLAAMAAVGAIEAALAHRENNFFEFCTTTAYGWPAPWTINYCLCEGGETSHPIAAMVANLSLFMTSGILGATLVMDLLIAQTVTAMNNNVRFLRIVALLEGCSFVLLLGVAMPLKYFAGMPLVVKFTGWAHGALFVVLCLLLLQVMIAARWSLRRSAMVFAAALLPLGPFLLDSRMRRWEREGGTAGPN